MSDSELVIREVCAGDLAELLPLYRQLLDCRAEDLSLSRAETIFLRIGNYPDYAIYLASLRERVVGTFALMIMDSLGHMGVPVAILEDVVVSEDCRGSGIGRAMIDFATEAARDKGCSKFFLCTGAERQQAHRFYENLGFRQHGFSYYLDLKPDKKDGSCHND